MINRFLVRNLAIGVGHFLVLLGLAVRQSVERYLLTKPTHSPGYALLLVLLVIMALDSAAWAAQMAIFELVGL